MEVEEKVFEIPSALMGEFNRKFKAIEKIAHKLSVKGYTVETLGTEVKSVTVTPDAAKSLGVTLPITTDCYFLGIGHKVCSHTPFNHSGLKACESFTDTDEHGSPTTLLEMVTLKITGESPMLDGYTLVGTIDPSKISRSAPGENIPARLLKKVGSCDHCKKIRNRAKNIVVRKGKTYKVVGSGCLKDFLGTRSRKLELSTSRLETFLEFFSFLEAYSNLNEDFVRGGSKGSPIYPLLKVMEITSKVITAKGYLSNSKKFNDAEGIFDGIKTTSSLVIDVFEPPLGKDMTGEREFASVMMSRKFSDEDGKEVLEALEWAENLGETNDKDYLRNLCLLTKEGFVRTEHKKSTMGLAVSLLEAFRNATKFEERKKMWAEEKAAKGETFRDKWGKSIFIGDKGDKLGTLEIEVLNVGGFSGVYGHVDIIKMGTSDGNILTWFSTSKTPDVLMEKGNTATITRATVKGTNEYKGIKETLINRVKIAA